MRPAHRPVRHCAEHVTRSTHAASGPHSARRLGYPRAALTCSACCAASSLSKRVTGESLAALGKCTALESLQIANCVTPFDPRALAQCRRLAEVEPRKASVQRQEPHSHVALVGAPSVRSSR